MDTIFALASGAGKAGVAIVRISGPSSKEISQKLSGSHLPEPRVASLRNVISGGGQKLDKAVYLRFEEGQSFTGEDVLELHLHGSQAVIESVLKELDSFEDTRLAKPGEFTRRALENGRLDLSQVDGLADLINAQTEAQQRQALRILDGRLSSAVTQWRSNLVRAAALIQANIDFSDEEIPDNLRPEIIELISQTRDSLLKEIEGYAASKLIRSGFEVAIIGEPNIGKSTLLNYLAGRDAALTSQTAGTTRDVIEVNMDVAGYSVTFLDTAGIRDADDPIEKLGIERGLQRAEDADCRVILIPQSDAVIPIEPRSGDLVYVAKQDEPSADRGFSGISGVSGYGVDDLLAVLSERLNMAAGNSSLLIRERYRASMNEAVVGLTSALDEIDLGMERIEIVAEELRAATYALDSMLGKVGVEDVLDEVFSSFCLGK